MRDYGDGLEAAAQLLERTAADFDFMTNQLAESKELWAANRRVSFREKAQLLRGQAKQIRELP